MDHHRNHIEKLSQFRNRIAWKDAPLDCLCVPTDQHLKIRPNGQFARFSGDTVIFDLDDADLAAAGKLASALYEEPDLHPLLCLALPEDSFHVTLHPLSDCTPDDAAGHRALVRLMDEHEPVVRGIFEDFKRRYPSAFRLLPSGIVSMDGRSVVLLLEPQNDEDSMALTAMYQHLDKVVPLRFPFTPHITLAYYKPDASALDAQALTAAFDRVFSMDRLPEFTLSQDRLRYCCFHNMKHFYSRTMFHARLSFISMRHEAISLHVSGNGLSFEDVLNTIAATGLSLSEAERKDRVCRAKRCVHSAPDTDIFLSDWLSAVILFNLLERDMLDEAASDLLRDNRVSDCLQHLYWNNKCPE